MSIFVFPPHDATYRLQMCMRVEYFTAAKLFTYYPKMKTALYNITFQDSSGPITAATATTRITASFTKLEEIGTTTKARTGLIQHAAGGFQTILQLQPLPKRTTRAANAREIAKGTFSETCASTKAKNLSKPRATTMIFLELVSFEMQLKVPSHDVDKFKCRDKSKRKDR